jgi:ElaB/YqjD/DUF883 family membrane-anchored ribosome-binding protein
MSEANQHDIIKQLIDNTEDIISVSKNDGPEKLTALAQRQKHLKQVLNENMPRLGSDISRASIEALRDLVAKAVDAVQAEMAQNRSSMQTTGIKKKVLSAYGTVTVSNTPSE